jgi:hypothetical protein
MAPSVTGGIQPSVTGIHHRLRGAISTAEGPLDRSVSGPFTNMQASTSMVNSEFGFQSISSSKPSVDEGSLELMSHDMSVSALYLHDLQNRKGRGQGQTMGYENLEDIRARNLWQRQDSHQGTGHGLMPNIQEKLEEGEGASSQTVTKSV